jgi:hypothetical protein
MSTIGSTIIWMPRLASFEDFALYFPVMLLRSPYGEIDHDNHKRQESRVGKGMKTSLHNEGRVVPSRSDFPNFNGQILANVITERQAFFQNKDGAATENETSSYVSLLFDDSAALAGSCHSQQFNNEVFGSTYYMLDSFRI